MQQEQLNLINFLKENDESVRKDLETLKFGTKISRCWSKYKMLNPWEFFDKNNRTFYLIDGICFRWDKLNIIWNNLDYHHIMMYCDSKWIWARLCLSRINIYKSDFDIDIYLDNSKPFHEQEPIVYKKLLDHFIWLQ